MSPLRVIALGAALAVIGGMAIPGILRSGRFYLRGPGPAITRRTDPAKFWTSVILHSAIAVIGLAVIGYGIVELLLPWDP